MELVTHCASLVMLNAAPRSERSGLRMGAISHLQPSDYLPETGRLARVTTFLPRRF
jgi:hypothetical protein